MGLVRRKDRRGVGRKYNNGGNITMVGFKYK